MRRVLSVAAERFPIAGTFTISRGSKTEAEVICCSIAEGGHAGRGECVPYRRYGETIDSVLGQIESVHEDMESGAGRDKLLSLLPAGAARNALDCALWDLEAKATGTNAAGRVCASQPTAIVTAYTLSLGTPEAMAAPGATTSPASAPWRRPRREAGSSSTRMKAGRRRISA
jgi:L-alanine-DL-glutamate epimerase-like enolase superfamily enzyme